MSPRLDTFGILAEAFCLGTKGSDTFSADCCKGVSGPEFVGERLPNGLVIGTLPNERGVTGLSEGFSEEEENKRVCIRCLVAA